MEEENPNTPLSSPGPNFSVFVYLPWKRPHSPGRKWANSRRLGRAGEQGATLCWGSRSPPWACRGSLDRGICVGARQEGGVGPRAASAPSQHPPPPRKRASVQEWDGGCRVPACLGVEEARTPAEDGPLAWPRAHLAPTCQPRVRGDLGAARPWCPQLFLGRCRPPVGGQPALCLPSPVHTPARQLAHPRASLPGVGLEAGESCGQSLALAVKAQAGVGLDGVMWALGEG